MKNVKKSLALLLSIGLTTSFFLTSCTLGGNNSSRNENSSPQEEIEKTGDYLLKDGNSSYKIVLPDDADADEVLAGERLQSLFKEATDTFLPIVKEFGMNPVQFGMILVYNLCIGNITPPVGNTLFVGIKVGRTSLAEVIPYMLIYYAAILTGLLLVTYVPSVCLGLPGLAGLL